ncbi:MULTISPECIES: beta family protein [Gammaproteobacteria]|uniref:beta family protein n=1 Tax=Gammaproteobacteria TaxID=1236 RepID=UPI0009B6C0E0|nr:MULTISPECIES: beta family protein [Gammaproteobacteria]HIO99600.1 hypothetical protein [Marinobacter salarius]
MMEKSFDYLPVLKWRQGEYQALMRLKTHVKDAVLPLIVVPPVEYDFEEERPKKTVQEHIEPFAKRYSAKWGKRNSLIDLHESLEGATMDSGSLVVTHIFDSLRSASLNAVPVVKISHNNDHLSAIKSIVSVDNKGVAIRVKMHHLMSPTLDGDIRKLVAYLGLNYQNVDLVIDLEVPQSFEPYAAFAKALSVAIKRISNIADFRSFSIVGTSLILSEIKKPGGEQVRHEWFLYQQLLKELSGVRSPTFGDYTIETPEFISLDMRRLKPAGKIVYTTENTWLISKGSNFRENNEQMVGHCKTIIESGYYQGRDYSEGDKRIYDTFHGVEGTGQLKTWKEVGVSHHITQVVDQLSKFHAP